ncbi:MAG TPA: hypothetical protein VN688_23760 [Gemmataceae bacterium]|nr:hypothetical protein [Gemmataceae bacterium]
MTRWFLLRSVLVVVGLFGAAWTEAGDTKAGKEKPPKTGGTVSGIVIDKRDMSIKVKVDGQEEPITYVVDASDKNTRKALAGIFTVARVRLAYKTNGDTRQLVGIQRIGRKGTGTITAVILATHESWVEVKTRNGSPEGFSATFPAERWKATVEKIKELHKGDNVAIRYYTDFERSRILSIQKIGK